MNHALSVFHNFRYWVLVGFTTQFVTKLAIDFLLIETTGALDWLKNN